MCIRNTETKHRKEFTMKVIVKVYDKCKYDRESKKVAQVEYDIEDFEVISGAEAEEIENECDANSIDEYHEYLILDLGEGKTATFRNSHVDLFEW